MMKNYYTRLSAVFCLMLGAVQLSGQGLTLFTQVFNVSCSFTCIGTIDLSVSGGTPGYTFQWSNGGTSQAQVNLCPGTYTVTVSDANGLTQSTSATVPNPSTMLLAVCATNVLCFGGNTGSISTTVSGGNPPYTYLWGNGATTQNINNLVAGTYTTTVTDAFGCTKTASATVTQPTALNNSITVTNASNGIANGFINITTTGGTPPYSFYWSGGHTSQDLLYLNPGNYYLTLTDVYGCTLTHSITVLGNGGTGSNPLAVNGNVTNTGCGANCSGSISATAGGGFAPYSYIWSSGNTTQVLTNACNGDYCVTVYDAQSNSATQCFFVGMQPTQVVDIQSSNAAFCNYTSGNAPPVCEMICPHSTVTYFFDPPVNCGVPLPASAIVWTIVGAESYSLSANARQVEVTWGEAGTGFVQLESNGQSTCFSSKRCVTIVEEPKAQFTTDPPAPSNAPLQLCKGQTVAFKNQSLHAERYEWHFSDNLSTVSTENTEHTFLAAGSFSVTLIAQSNCLCADTTVLLVEVLDTEPPLLDCVGSVCPGETVKYSTSSNCSSYTWVVSANGTVLDGGNSSDNSITVQWGQGPNGTISLSASGCGGATCPQASVFIIPIISDNAEIRGNESVCKGSEEEYSINQFDGTEYVWKLPSGGSILRGQGTNKISVAWTASANDVTVHWLTVEYYNCYLGCGGQDSIPVKILPTFYIKGVVEMCENTAANFQSLLNASTGIRCDWFAYKEDGSLFWTSPSNVWSINFPTTAAPGKYRLLAIPTAAGKTCSPSAELIFNIVARPPKPAGLAGPKVICPSTPLSYSVLGTGLYTVSWTVSGGGPAAQTGNPINVSWNNSANRWLSAAHISTDGLGCKSDTAKLNVTAISGLSVTGVPGLCEGSVAYYEADFYPGFDYQWQLIPADAGTIKSGQGKNNVEIYWQRPGAHKVRVTSCAISADFNVAVWANPAPMVSVPAGLCPNDSTLVTTTTPFSAYSWQLASGPALSAAASVNIPSGSYAVAVTDANGCKGSIDFEIAKYPKPNVSVSTAHPTGFCNNSEFVPINTVVPEGSQYSFAWLHDNVPFGGNTAVISTNQYGFYTVVATNEYGCTAQASPMLLFNYCGGGCSGFCPLPPHPKCPPGSMDVLTFATPRCDSMNLAFKDFTGQYVPGSGAWWTGISGGALVGTATGDNASFVYPNAGKYIIVFKALLQNGAVCEVVDSLDVEAVALFSQRQACPGDTTLFVDESTRLPDASIVGWAWDFGEPGSTDVSSLPSPGYPYANAGDYTATLTITSATGCTATYSENVFVPDFPSPTFSPPLANCAGNASAFSLANPAGIIKTEWNFGHPASGALNSSTGNTAYHNFSPAGNYPVTLTATNNYGCKGSINQSVAIVPNPFSGNITPANAVICEGKTITLVAPSGPGASYVWSDASNAPTLTVGQEGVFSVTLTNGNGCTYSPPKKTVDMNPAPVGVIKALELNAFGQVIGVSYPTLSVCYGEDVNLQVQDNGSYTFQWSGGNGNNETLIFSEDRGNLLPIGAHTYTVTLTNPATGCTAVLAPFTVNVNPVPSNFSLATDDVCAGTPSTITYTGPQPPNWNILWNTGATGPSLLTEDAGLYFVRVVNEFGCSTQSNTVVIFPGPNIAALPAGCHERCNPDTLCLPPLPEIVSWQWYFEGNPIPGATSNQFAATQSGTYFADLVDIHGCQAQSADLTVELYDGYGNILGQVWSDVNNNGVIDAADTLVAFVPVQLWQNGALVNANVSGANGGFDWQNVLATGYTVQIDSQALDPHWQVVILADSVSLSGCGGKTFADLLVKAFSCPPTLASIALSACPGASALYNGTGIPTGQSMDFTVTDAFGCDSIITVTVSALPVSTSSLAVSACPGSTYTYQGVDLAVGQTQAFTLTNALGCDSIVTVTVSALPTSASTLAVSACPGSTYTYAGVDLAVGQTQAFTLTNALGCDSIVTVTVSALPTSASTLAVSACPGSTYTYAGVALAVGQTQAFTLANALGCDSIVTVTVSALPASTSTLAVSACPGSSYTYQGVALAVGQTQAFTLTNALGCDSIVTVTVSALPTSASTLAVSACPGSTYTYQGVALAVGQTQAFTLTNALGCDSIVTVTVSALPTSASTLAVSACPGSTYTYQGVALAVGQTQAFTLTNALGCDSIVTVTVSALPTTTGAVTFGVCPNETFTFQGQSLAAGTVQAFTLTNALGCDSILTVTVLEKASSADIIEVKVCPGESYIFNSEKVAIGEAKDFHFSNSEGCDSLITIQVTAWPSLQFDATAQRSCPNQSQGSIAVNVLPGGSQPTGYALNGGAFQTDNRFSNLAPGAYTVAVQDEHGCVVEGDATVLASAPLEVILHSDYMIPCDSSRITLAPILGGDTVGLQLSWWNGAHSLSTSTSEAGPVWLDASNHCGEQLHRAATVAWMSSDGAPINIFVPNIFAPNASKPENALFRPFFGSNFTLLDYRLEVYDRWGSLLFQSEQPENGWEGSFRDKLMEPGVYVWQLWVKVAFCGREMEMYRKGDVTVER